MDEFETYFFAVVVDGEVAMMLAFGSIFPSADKLNAIYSSDPKIIKTDRYYPEGTLWDGKTFTVPESE